jgi:ferredoxin|tara:strand:- start:686 stop:844 length:159 start_codon:yes stop_codon:yes gene_type:complete
MPTRKYHPASRCQTCHGRILRRPVEEPDDPRCDQCQAEGLEQLPLLVEAAQP